MVDFICPMQKWFLLFKGAKNIDSAKAKVKKIAKWCNRIHFIVEGHISRVPDQNGISQLYNMLEMYHSCPEP